MELGFKPRVYDFGAFLEALTRLPQHVSVLLKLDSCFFESCNVVLGEGMCNINNLPLFCSWRFHMSIEKFPPGFLQHSFIYNTQTEGACGQRRCRLVSSLKIPLPPFSALISLTMCFIHFYCMSFLQISSNPLWSR